MRKIILIVFMCMFCLGAIHAEVEWTLSEDGTLIISGGEMDNYNTVENLPPWLYQGGIDPKKSITIRKVIIKDDVTNIGREAFSHCTSLISVTIGNSVTSIGECAFGQCSALTSITIPNSVTTIGKQAFWNCRGLTSVTIPTSVTSIGLGAFASCTGLTSVIIPNSVTTIEYDTFVYCPSLTSITIPSSVTHIEHGAFKNCPGLTSVTIPNSVTGVGYEIFDDCSSLTTLICYAVEPPVCEKGIRDDIEYTWFNNVPTSTGTLYVPASAISAYKTADQWKEWKNIKAIEDGVTTGLRNVVDGKTADERMYNLNGQRINRLNAPKGIYIKNGKKYAR